MKITTIEKTRRKIRRALENNFIARTGICDRKGTDYEPPAPETAPDNTPAIGKIWCTTNQ